MTALLADALAAALGAREKALQRRALLDIDAGDLQFVDVGAVVVLGIGDRRLESFLDEPAAFFGLKLRMLSALSTG